MKRGIIELSNTNGKLTVLICEFKLTLYLCIYRHVSTFSSLYDNCYATKQPYKNSSMLVLDSNLNTKLAAIDHGTGSISSLALLTVESDLTGVSVPEDIIYRWQSPTDYCSSNYWFTYLRHIDVN